MKKLLIIIFFVIFPLLAVAQESIEEPVYFKDHYSIIREVNQKESLIYNCYQGLSMFTLTYEGNSTAEIVANGYLFQYIRDFEILNGEDVYFCGERYDWGANNKLTLKDVFIGHFTMSDFRNTTQVDSLNIDTISLYNSLRITLSKKLEVFEDDGGLKHVVVTGTETSGSGCIVDAYISGGSWYTHATPTPSQTEIYYDVAVTDHYVAVSAQSTANSTGYILLFNKPTPGNSVFPYPSVNFNRITLPYSVDGEILLEACEQDAFVSACHSAGSNAVYISGFDGTTHLATVGMPLQSNLSPCSQLKDISYGPYSKDLEVLQYELIGSDTASIVYHIGPSVLTDPVPVVYGNYYKCQTLCSIVNKRHLDGYTFASGHPFRDCYNELYNNYKVLRKYVLMQGSYGNCTEERATRIWLFEKGPSVVIDMFQTSFRRPRGLHWLWEKCETSVNIICN